MKRFIDIKVFLYFVDDKLTILILKYFVILQIAKKQLKQGKNVIILILPVRLDFAI